MNEITQRFAAIGIELTVPALPQWRRRKKAPANKLSRNMPDGMNYRYWSAPKNGKGQRVRFCWSCHRNDVGYFLGWREVIMKNGRVRRDMWAARRSRKRCKALAQRRAAAATTRAGVQPAVT